MKAVKARKITLSGLFHTGRITELTWIGWTIIGCYLVLTVVEFLLIMRDWWMPKIKRKGKRR